MSTPSVFTIAPGYAFVDRLAEGVLAAHGDRPETLSRLRILLPTRRAVRDLREAFLQAADGKALLLPRMSPLGEADEDMLALHGLAESVDLAPAVAELQRACLLARLILRWQGRAGDILPGPLSPANALRLARALAALIDSVQTEELDFAGLETLVEGDLSAHWRRIVDFLRIITAHWPAILAERGESDPAARRNRLLSAMATLWRDSPPDYPVIAAGSTGSIPATARLLSVVARLPAGQVVLPGLDVTLDDDTWAAVGRDPAHPQYMLHRLLETMQVSRHEVRSWGDGDTPPRAARMRMLSDVLRPAEALSAVTLEGEDIRAMTRGLSRIDCPGRREEAGVIALLLRETLETPGRTAALVTPDRVLARQVAAELKRWSVEIDDSAGQPLATTPPGAFLRLVARAAASGLAPVDLLALLKHPLAAAGRDPAALRRLARRLDRHESRAGFFLRGVRPAPGSAGLCAEAETHDLPDDLRRLLDDVATALAPLEALTGRESAPVVDMLDAHLRAAESLAATDGGDGPARLWRSDAGVMLAETLAEARMALGGMAAIAGDAWPALFETLLDGRVLRPAHGGHPRLAILGPLEARLRHADRMILGGLNDGVWPPDQPHDPWMSREMRARFGLGPADRRIGQSAHDFVQVAGAEEVIFTRAARIDGTPTVESRWLTRLTALAAKLEGGVYWLGVHAGLDRPARVTPCLPPSPRPPVAARPRRLSVTGVETWRRDPYAIYARHILKLRPLEPLDAEPGALERGTVMHDALDMYVRRRTGREDAGAAMALLLDCGRAAFAAHLARPAVRAFWWPRFERVAARLLEIEAQRAGSYEIAATETTGQLTVAAGTSPFLLTAKADRIDRLLGDDGYEIIDYKTGAPPTDKRIAAGYAPQLPLEGWMLQEGAFGDVPKGPVAGLSHWQLKGTREPIAISPVKLTTNRIAEAQAGLMDMIARFDRDETPYLSNPRPAHAGYGDYDHLARVQEWTALPDPSGEEP